MDKLLLRLISFFYPLLARNGVDTVQINEILRVKLLLDSRRPSMLFTGQRKSGSKVTSPWWTSIVLILFGSFLGVMLMTFNQPLLGQTIYFTMFMLLLAVTMISDFTAVLLDTRDQFIILPRPVNDRTLALSRILHITLYVLRMALLLGVAGIIIAAFKDGVLAAPVMLLQIIGATILTVLLVNIIYLLLMQLVSAQKFKEIISYFQVALSIVMFGSYYLLPRLIDASALRNVALLSHPWAYAMPPVWIGAINEVLLHPGRSNIITSVLAVAGLTVPLLGMWLVARVLAPGFNRRLAVIATADDNSTAAPVLTSKPVKSDLRDRLANRLAPDPAENAGFKLTWKLAARLRTFKIKVYPAYAYVPIYFLYFALNTKGDNWADRFAHLQQGRQYILLIYLCTFVISVFLQNVSYTEKFKASWVFYALPVRQPGRVLSGMYKAIAVLYFLPYCLLAAVVIIAIWGPQTINDIILAYLVSLIYGLLLSLLLLKGMPFSKPVLLKQSGGRMLTSMFITGFMFLAGFGHYFLARWETVIWILIIPAIGVFWLMMHYYAKQGWDSVEVEDVL